MNIETQSLVAGRDNHVTIDPYDLNPLAFDFFHVTRRDIAALSEQIETLREEIRRQSPP